MHTKNTFAPRVSGHMVGDDYFDYLVITSRFLVIVRCIRLIYGVYLCVYFYQCNHSTHLCVPLIPMKYKQTLKYLLEQLPMFQRVGAAAYRADLTNITQLCNLISNPQGWPAMHTCSGHQRQGLGYAYHRLYFTGTRL